MQRIIHAIVRPGDESGYVGEVAELNVVTQGATLDDVAQNLRDAVGLALESEDLAQLGLAPNPVLAMTFEMEPLVAPA